MVGGTGLELNRDHPFAGRAPASTIRVLLKAVGPRARTKKTWGIRDKKKVGDKNAFQEIAGGYVTKADCRCPVEPVNTSRQFHLMRWKHRASIPLRCKVSLSAAVARTLALPASLSLLPLPRRSFPPCHFLARAFLTLPISPHKLGLLPGNCP
ncbi:hypothetical protein KM043_007287 [Ampulex compressa]|nr:hypothetical protein KM043_007287 [Ampulex compressa]